MNVSAGCRTIALDDAGAEPAFRMVVMYPSPAAERPARLGPYDASLATDAAVAEGTFPLVVVSHGTGGSPLVYRALAAHLARRGFVVACPEHPRNNRDDDSLGGTDTILERRPRDVCRAIDRVLADDALGPHVDAGRIAMIGHSLGGYTALALAGGRPSARPHETADERPRALDVRPDPRVRALVLLAPATPWFMADGALRDVRLPILMLTAERDAHAPAWFGQIVTRGVADASRVTHRVVPNAGHFAFLTPFPPALTRPEFPPSQDPPGFDRAAFQAEMHVEIETFLRTVL